MNIGFVGIGAMGVGMVRNLLQAGFNVSVWNRTQSATTELVQAGARLATTPLDCANADLVISMLADDASTTQITLDPNFIAALPPAALHVCMATISVGLGERLAYAYRAAGKGYLSAPVFGRPPAAAAAQLFIVVAGAAADIARAEPAFKAMSQRVFVVGEQPSVANVVKVSGNFLLASMIESLGEAFALVRKHGLDPDQFLEILTNTIFPAPVYKMYGGLIARDNFEPAGFKLALGLKDVRLAQAAADAAMVPMPLAGLLHDRYMAAIARGYGDFDWAGIARLCAEDAALPKRA